MRIKWYLRNKSTQDFGKKPAFLPKSLVNPPSGHSNVKGFLSQIEEELFQIPDRSLPNSNLTKYGWEAVRPLADDRSFIIKEADKVSRILVWDWQTIYIYSFYRNSNIYRDASLRKGYLVI